LLTSTVGGAEAAAAPLARLVPWTLMIPSAIAAATAALEATYLADDCRRLRTVLLDSGASVFMKGS